MVRPGMKRYRQRTAAQAALVGDDGDGRLDPAALFGRRAPLRLEVGCGHGEFLSQMAAAHPEEDFIGVERQGLRVTKTAHKGNRLDAANLRLFRDDAGRFLHRRLPPACLHRCYAFFPDPWPKRRHRRRRFVNRRFLVDLARAMRPGGRFEFSSDCHNYAMQVVSHASTLPGLWRNAYLPAGVRFDLPTRFPTVFERHRRSDGSRVAFLRFVRSDLPVPSVLPPPSTG